MTKETKQSSAPPQAAQSDKACGESCEKKTKAKPFPMGPNPSIDNEVRYANVVFLNAVIPLLKPIVAEKPELAAAFKGKEGVVQISCLTPAGTSIDGRPERYATHLIIHGASITPKLGAHPLPNVEIEFPSPEKLNDFFKGKVNLPKIRGGLSNPGLLVATVKALLVMSSLLGATAAPKIEDDRKLLTKCMFYLLTTGMSQLNKAGHLGVHAWTDPSPDRVYAYVVDGHPELGAYIRIKAGKSKAFRGEYTRSAAFFTMRFDSVTSALGTLLQTDDLLDAQASGRMSMEGSPEYGAELGALMMAVGDYAK
ncbi:hypothetical protein [Mobiluncus curtisii]|uniref:SCP2 domain-containing protein n=1 Tax=Mobiluncus curtisii ATCC 51333 TaxID=887326 RepID=E6M0J4_9ACTO|nr:hypothetical protein [Mobiluncus curtisii]EFU79474.1 hypothetical protein HMPREF0388_1577 [Mobiluncus curtisii ATCC 51333]